MTDHTPGPWKTEGNPTDVWGRHGELIAKCFFHRLSIDESEENWDMAVRNARLIAASPILYDFVRELADGGNEKAKVILDSLDISDK